VEFRGNFEKWRVWATQKSGEQGQLSKVESRGNFEKWRVEATLKSGE